MMLIVASWIPHPISAQPWEASVWTWAPSLDSIPPDLIQCYSSAQPTPPPLQAVSCPRGTTQAGTASGCELFHPPALGCIHSFIHQQKGAWHQLPPASSAAWSRGGCSHPGRLEMSFGFSLAWVQESENAKEQVRRIAQRCVGQSVALVRVVA